MLFEKQKIFLIKSLRQIGANVTETKGSYLCVDNKYEICCTNMWYRNIGEETCLGQGAMKFIKIIEKEQEKKKKKKKKDKKRKENIKKEQKK